MAANELTGKSTKLAAIGWGILAFMAVSTALGALRYGLPHVPFPAPLPNFRDRHNWLIAHAVCSAIALLAGPWQFLPRFRNRWLTGHRWIGRVYILAVGAGWIASLPIAAHAQTGAVASTGFLVLGIFWVSTTAAAYRTVRRGEIDAHRNWMTRSYSLTAAAVTLRCYLPLLQLSGLSFAVAYPIVAWTSWISNLVFAEWLIRRRESLRSSLQRVRAPKRLTVPSPPSG